MSKLIKQLVIITGLTLFGITSIVIAAEREINGVVTSKNSVANSITVRNDATGRRHTYFLELDTKLNSVNGPITFKDIKAGQEVALKFDDKEDGRRLVLFNVPDLDNVVEIIPVEFDETFSISGKVTGVRPVRRTVTLRSDETNELLTLNVPQGTSVVRNGAQARLRDMRIGDEVSFRYQATEYGYVVVTDSGVRQSTDDNPAPVAAESTYDESVAELPKTAANQYIWLLMAFGMLAVAIVMNYLRRKGR